MIAPARAAAFRVLQQVDSGALLSDALVRERDGLPDPRDRALVTELATGTLRWRGALDHELAAASSRPWREVDTAIRNILRLGAYQVRHLDRIPARAAVDDAVTLTRVAGQARAAGFVNALLRRLTRTQPAAHRGGSNEALAAELSHPPWIVSRWLQRYGPDALAQWATFNNTPAPLTLRTNTLAGTRDELVRVLAAEGVVVRPTQYARDGLIVLEGHPVDGPAARAGRFVVQDEASQLVGELAVSFAVSRALDTCAAPGGKTLMLAARLTRAALVVAADRRPRRLRVLRQTLKRAGAVNVKLVQIDSRRGLPFAAAFDLVLVDAPCSGLGTLRREPDIKWRRTEAELSQLAAAQGDMLDAAARAVAPDGHLVYATCSSEPEENEAVIEGFLERTPTFAKVTPVVSGGLAQVIDRNGHLRTYPHVHGLEAFFAAVLKRK